MSTYWYLLYSISLCDADIGVYSMSGSQRLLEVGVTEAYGDMGVYSMSGSHSR